MKGRIGAAGIAREISSGIVGSFLALAYCFSYAALIFSGPLTPHLAVAVASALVASAAVCIPVALFGGFRVAVATPVSHTAAPIAAAIGALAPALSALPPQDALALALAALVSTTLFTAATLYALGALRLGMMARFIPYPVITGFLAATGWLITAGALRIAADGAIDIFTPAWPPREIAANLALTVLFALAIWILNARFTHYLVLPSALIFAGVAAHLVLTAAGISADEARAVGILFDPGGGVRAGVLPIDVSILSADWALLLPVAGSMATVTVMAVISVLLNATGMELVERSHADLDRELKVHGAANALSGLMGGLVALVSLSNTMLNRAAGGRTRLSGAVVGMVAIAALIGGTQALGQIPVFLLCGLLLQMGAKLLWDCLWQARKRLPLRDRLVALAIVAMTAVFGFVQGVLFGLVASCIIFALDVARIGVVRHQFTLSQRPSIVVRSEAESRVVAEHGGRIWALQLDGFVFFGSAFQLVQSAIETIETKKPHTMIFDFTACSGVDSSAVASLLRLWGDMQQSKVRIIVVGMTGEVAALLKPEASGAGSFADLNRALEACEERLIAEHLPDAGAASSLHDWLAAALGGPEQADKLVSHLRRAPLLEGDYLCRQGDATASLLFIESGRVDVLVAGPRGAELRVRVFSHNTIAGEIGFLLKAPRTASMRAKPGASVWLLDHETFEGLSKSEPALATALLNYIARLQAERLAFATRQIAALQ